MPAHEKLNDTQFVFHKATPKEMGGTPYHTVEAWKSEHAGTAWAQTHPVERARWTGSSVDPGIKPISSMSWSHKTGEVQGVYTHSDYQRQGHATRVWQESHRIAAETRGVTKPRHSAQRTRSGEAWSKAVGGRRPRRSA
jgi:predicted GNAT family acetyltransferase